MKKIKVLVLLISLLTLHAEEISFKELTKLASQDLGTNIYLDKDIPAYVVDFNIVDHQKKGEIYEFYKIALQDNDMFLQYNSRGKFYYVKEKNKVIEPVTLPELPIIPDNQKVHYYAYKIKNITNKDVVDVMSIFQDVNSQPIKFSYLKQSDMIAYASTAKTHREIKRMLRKSDNSVKHSTVKITLFTTNKTKILEEGTHFEVFNAMFDYKLDGVVSALRNGDASQFFVKDTFNFKGVVSFMQSRGFATITQEPTMYLTNGIEAKVQLVKNISYKVSSVTRKDNTETTTDQLQYRDIGFKLFVIPKIKSNWVYLDLNLVSEELLTSDKNQLPVTQKITYQNSVKIYKGKPILLTGLKKTAKKYERGGIPILSDIPLIGELFKNKRNQTDEQNINILIEVL